MRPLVVSNHVSLDGFFVDAQGGIGWAHGNDPEWQAFVAENARSGGELLFGRITSELMAGYWPTPLAQEQDPIVAEQMNNLPKVVFSRTLTAAPWSNTRLARGDLVAEVRAMKRASGRKIVVFGSGTLVSQLAHEGLVDECQIIVNPVILGQGRTQFAGVAEKLRLRLNETRTFSNGNVVLSYKPF